MCIVIQGEGENQYCVKKFKCKNLPEDFTVRRHYVKTSSKKKLPAGGGAREESALCKKATL
jgi:hypothetical protein